jgi:hypothetical protein
MSALAKLLILATVAGDGSPEYDTHHPDAVPVFGCSFDRDKDRNYDGWPDYWKRQLGPGLPHYVPVGIEPTDEKGEDPSLVVHLDGGGALVETPFFSVSDKFSYKVEARVRIRDVEYAKARLRIEFCDDEKQVLESDEGEWLSTTKGWDKIEIGPVNPAHPRVRSARLVFHVKPGDRADLKGSVALDDLWASRLPKMTVRTSNPFNVYTDPKDIEVSCELSGILNKDPDIVFELLDASSHQLDKNGVKLEGQLINERLSKASEFVDTVEARRAAYAGVTSWRPPIQKHGFYKIRVTMQTTKGMLKRDVINVALVPPLTRPQKGEFGWSLASSELPMSLDDLATLLPRVAVHWVKMPVWYGESEETRGEQLVEFTEQISAKDIEVVGVLDHPPADSELAKRLAQDAAIADVLATDSTGWLPLIDPVLSRLSLRVRWWQLGSDLDSSFSGLGGLEKELFRLRDKLFRFGQDVNLGIGWPWNRMSGSKVPATWEFQQFSAKPALTGDEMGAYLDLPKRGEVSRWVLVEPLSRSSYDLETRARDLVEQMLAAKIHGADAIFAAHPFDDEVGLMTSRGTPSELLLPWRTAASLLGGARYLGSLRLPQGSHNRLFEAADGSVVMAVWSDEPIEETINLGENVRLVDVWGRETTPARRDDKQVIEVELLPKFVRGLNPAVTRWRMAASFAVENVPSVFGRSHPNQIRITNTFPQGVGGSIELKAPQGWQVSPNRIDFKLAAGETADMPFEISLPFDANSGPAPIRADFTVDADEQHRFSVFSELKVGDGQIELETSTRIDSDGSLIVEQRMVNHSPELVDFKCFLMAPGRRRQRMQVFRLGDNADVKVYRYPNGADLVGPDKVFWLRAEEVNGSRVLNHRFVAEQ